MRRYISVTSWTGGGENAAVGASICTLLIIPLEFCVQEGIALPAQFRGYWIHTADGLLSIDSNPYPVL